jgi:nicotinamide-nucleotide amidase
LGGIVTYANRIKETQLAIDPHVLKRYGAVSPEIARALAQNVRERMGSTYGIGITGIAGPGGATAGKPVGLVYVALATPRRTKVSEFQFSGSRDAVRTRAVTAALDALRQELLVKTRRFR